METTNIKIIIITRSRDRILPHRAREVLCYADNIAVEMATQKKSHIILKPVGQLIYLCHYSLTHATGGSFLGGRLYSFQPLRLDMGKANVLPAFASWGVFHPTIALWRV